MSERKSELSAQDVVWHTEGKAEEARVGRCRCPSRFGGQALVGVGGILRCVMLASEKCLSFVNAMDDKVGRKRRTDGG